MVTNRYTQGPSYFIPESQKDALYHKRWHDYILNRGTYNIGRIPTILRNYNFYLGKFDVQREHQFLTVTDSGLEFPADFANFNEIFGLIEFLMGEMSQRGYGVDVEALSTKAISRKRDAQLAMEVDHDLMPLYEQIEDISGLNMVQKEMPRTPEELEEKKANYKESGEIIAQRLLNYFIQQFQFDIRRVMMTEQAHVAGDCHVLMDYKNGQLIPQLVPSEFVLYDGSAQDIFLRDAGFKGIVRYENLADVYAKYDFSDEDRERLETKVNETITLGGWSETNNQYDILRTTNQGVKQVLTTQVWWKDIRVQQGMEIDGNYTIRDVYSEEGRMPTNGSEKDVENIRFCTVVGNDLIPKNGFGNVDWIPRTPDDQWTKPAIPLLSFVPRLFRGEARSTVELLIPLQKIKDRAFYMISKAMKRDRGKSVVNDAAQRPADTTMFDQAYFMETVGMLEIHSRKHGTPANYNQFQQIDLSLSPAVQYYMEIFRMASDEMSRIVGIPDVRMGNVTGDRQAVGVTEMSIAQSSVRTQRFYAGFDQFTENIFRFGVGIYRKEATRHPEKFKHIVGDDGVDYLKNDKDYDLEDYGIYINVNQTGPQQRKAIMDMTMAAANKGTIDIIDGLDVILEKDPKEARDMLRKLKTERKKEIQQQQQMQMQAAKQEKDQVTQIEMAKLQLEREKIEADRMGDYMRRLQESDSRINQIRAQGQEQRRTDAMKAGR